MSVNVRIMSADNCMEDPTEASHWRTENKGIILRQRGWDYTSGTHGEIQSFDKTGRLESVDACVNTRKVRGARTVRHTA